MSSAPITIVGGGLAGLALGIGLRQRGVPVTIWEAGNYPRHRVCGEFISGLGQDSLARLGLLDLFLKAGARRATDAAFYSETRSTKPQQLPQSAICLSRYVMDDLLAREFTALGGDLRTNQRWRGDAKEPGIVHASGRRIQAISEGWRFFGLKAHARKACVEADLEIHLSPAGYVGLCKLPGDEVNVCGLFRSHTPVPNLNETWGDWLRGKPGSPLHERLKNSEFLPDSFCSVAGLSLEQHHATGSNECSIGDALTMIPPVTGNGMSMAFESAEIAIEPLTLFHQQRLGWDDTVQQIAKSCDATFARRLSWAARLQSALMSPHLSSALLWITPKFGWLWRGLFWRTR